MKKTAVALLVIFMILFSSVTASAASDSAVTIVNPGSGSEVFGSTLLVSVKITAPRTIKVAVYEQKEKVGDNLVSINPSKQKDIKAENIRSVAVMDTETFVCPDNLRFYSKELNNLSPGLYKITVNTVNSAGAVTYSTNALVAIRPADEAASVTFDNQQGGALQWIQNLFKSIFGN